MVAGRSAPEPRKGLQLLRLLTQQNVPFPPFPDARKRGVRLQVETPRRTKRAILLLALSIRSLR
jgi:hypothetical protein